jgi:hypothetical protein
MLRNRWYVFFLIVFLIAVPVILSCYFLMEANNLIDYFTIKVIGYPGSLNPLWYSILLLATGIIVMGIHLAGLKRQVYKGKMAAIRPVTVLLLFGILFQPYIKALSAVEESFVEPEFFFRYRVAMLSDNNLFVSIIMFILLVLQIVLIIRMFRLKVVKSGS